MVHMPWNPDVRTVAFLRDRPAIRFVLRGRIGCRLDPYSMILADRMPVRQFDSHVTTRTRHPERERIPVRGRPTPSTPGSTGQRRVPSNSFAARSRASHR